MEGTPGYAGGGWGGCTPPWVIRGGTAPGYTMVLSIPATVHGPGYTGDRLVHPPAHVENNGC